MDSFSKKGKFLIVNFSHHIVVRDMYEFGGNLHTYVISCSTLGAILNPVNFLGRTTKWNEWEY